VQLRLTLKQERNNGKGNDFGDCHFGLKTLFSGVGEVFAVDSSLLMGDFLEF